MSNNAALELRVTLLGAAEHLIGALAQAQQSVQGFAVQAVEELERVNRAADRLSATLGRVGYAWRSAAAQVADAPGRVTWPAATWPAVAGPADVGIGGRGGFYPSIPQLAAGGIVTGPTLAMIGEAGPKGEQASTEARGPGKQGGQASAEPRGPSQGGQAGEYGGLGSKQRAKQRSRGGAKGWRRGGRRKHHRHQRL